MIWKLLFFFFFLKIYLFMTVLGLCCCAGFSLVAASRGYSQVSVLKSIALTAMASLVAESGL